MASRGSNYLTRGVRRGTPPRTTRRPSQCSSSSRGEEAAERGVCAGGRADLPERCARDGHRAECTRPPYVGGGRYAAFRCTARSKMSE
jgi:hypothetical protein